jgi:hypothetical protein
MTRGIDDLSFACPTRIPLLDRLLGEFVLNGREFEILLSGYPIRLLRAAQCFRVASHRGCLLVLAIFACTADLRVRLAASSSYILARSSCSIGVLAESTAATDTGLLGAAFSAGATMRTRAVKAAQRNDVAMPLVVSIYLKCVT